MMGLHYPSLSITIHHYPYDGSSLSITIHMMGLHYPSLSITIHMMVFTIHHYPYDGSSLSITIHHYPSLSITIHMMGLHYPSRSTFCSVASLRTAPQDSYGLVFIPALLSLLLSLLLPLDFYSLVARLLCCLLPSPRWCPLIFTASWPSLLYYRVSTFSRVHPPRLICLTFDATSSDEDLIRFGFSEAW